MLRRKSRETSLRVFLIHLLSKFSIHENNLLLIKNNTQPYYSSSTEHARRIKVFCCLIMFCIALKAFVQENVSVREKNTHFRIRNRFRHKIDARFPRASLQVPALDPWENINIILFRRWEKFKCFAWLNIFMTIFSGLATFTPQKGNFFFCEGYIQQGHSIFPFFFLILELPLDL